MSSVVPAPDVAMTHVHGIALGSGSAGTGTLFREVAPWLGALVLLVIAGAVLVAWLRRVARGDGQELGGEGFTLQELREMHASGLLTDEQFERARDEMLGRLRSPGRSPGGGGTGDSRP